MQYRGRQRAEPYTEKTLVVKALEQLAQTYVGKAIHRVGHDFDSDKECAQTAEKFHQRNEHRRHVGYH